MERVATVDLTITKNSTELQPWSTSSDIEMLRLVSSFGLQDMIYGDNGTLRNYAKRLGNPRRIAISSSEAVERASSRNLTRRSNISSRDIGCAGARIACV